MTTSVSTCLWFNGRSLEAARFYTSLVAGSQVFGEFDPNDGDPLVVEFTIGGVPYQILNGGAGFPQTEAASIVLSVDGQAEVDRLWSLLTADGGVESRCGWLKDKFGVSWQVVPKEFGALMAAADNETRAKLAAAMMEMRKLDLAVFENIVAESDN